MAEQQGAGGLIIPTHRQSCERQLCSLWSCQPIRQPVPGTSLWRGGTGATFNLSVFLYVMVPYQQYFINHMAASHWIVKWRVIHLEHVQMICLLVLCGLFRVKLYSPIADYLSR